MTVVFKDDAGFEFKMSADGQDLYFTIIDRNGDNISFHVRKKLIPDIIYTISMFSIRESFCSSEDIKITTRSELEKAYSVFISAANKPGSTITPEFKFFLDELIKEIKALKSKNS